jgi:hypothetical protein
MFQLVKAITCLGHIITTTMVALSRPTKMLTKHMFLNLVSNINANSFFLVKCTQKRRKDKNLQNLFHVHHEFLQLVIQTMFFN